MGKYNAYTEEQELFLHNSSFGLTRQELTNKFNAKFDTNKSLLAIKSWCNNRKFMSGLDGRFDGTNPSWQKGLKGDEYKSHYSESSLIKAQSGISNRRKHEIGGEITRSGRPYIIKSVDKNTDLDRRIVSKRRYVYENLFGKIPKGHKIINLDGNAFNCCPANLCCIPAKYIPILNKNGWLTESAEHTLTAIKWCELFYARKDKKGRG